MTNNILDTIKTHPAVIQYKNKVKQQDQNGYRPSSEMRRQPSPILITTPLPTEAPDIFKLLDKHIEKNSNILIIDDIDCDGTGACYIAHSYLKKLTPKVSAVSNTQHGVPVSEFDNLIAKSHLTDFDKQNDLIIIVDSSTSNADAYLDNLETDIIILDHHQTTDPSQYEAFKNRSTILGTQKHIVIDCNSKRTPGLECISAGMLTYIVFNEYYTTRKDRFTSTSSNTYDDPLGLSSLFDDDTRTEAELNLFEIGALTNISDIVPVDTTVANITIEYILRHGCETYFTSEILNQPSNQIDKYKCQWCIIPTINYTRRIGDDLATSLIYDNKFDIAREMMIKNHQKGKDIVKTLETYTEITEHKNFIHGHIKYIKGIVQETTPRFTGLLCNILLSRYHKPTIVSIEKSAQADIKLSVRSGSTNVLEYFKKQPQLTGGGHKSACGFQANNLNDLLEAIKDLDNYIETAEVELAEFDEYTNISQLLNKKDMFELALYNELCFSNLEPYAAKIDNIDLPILERTSDNSSFKIKYNDTLLSVISVDGTLKDLIIKPLYQPQSETGFELVACSAF